MGDGRERELVRVRLIEGMGKHQDKIVIPEDNCKT